VSVFEQYCQSAEGIKLIYLAEKFLEQVRKKILESENRTYHKQYKSNVGEYSFSMELRGFEKLLFSAEINKKDVSFIIFERNSKNFTADRRQLTVSGQEQNCQDFHYFSGIFKGIRRIDNTIHQKITTNLDFELDQTELEILGFQGKEDVRDALMINHSFTKKVKESDLEEPVKEIINQKLDPIVTFFKKKNELTQEQKHNFERLLKEDLPNLISAYCELDREEREIQKEEFIQAIDGITSSLMDRAKEVTLGNFKKHLTLFKKRYQ